ncbi:MAG: carbon-monoxide dehydrogenase catalytic subunit [Actinobacteria bacterium HGW-Actinobacteria-7]|jgi:carbon-monoxide dehydrogenase catalytic subunit|nr:MAG: carbon-monoxide dehydrogenase catalytic subunit [Actinobacteria bacterium HGW-Actinobacteria-7]
MSDETTTEAEQYSIDPTAAEMLEIADECEISTVFSRSRSIKPCSTGSTGGCCKLCAMGPCRLIGKHDRGVCGADRETIAARNFVRQVAAGAAAHSDHGRDVALTLHAIAHGEIEGVTIADTVKLAKVAGYMGIEVAGKDAMQLAGEVADCALAQFGQQTGELVYVGRAPQKRQDLWRKLGVVPRGIDREVVEALHRTHAGTDQNYQSLLDGAIKCSLASGWGGSMLATDLQDILYGTPTPVRSAANLGVLSDEKVNILIHGHEPLLASMIIDATSEPEMVELAKSLGATGINVAGICCTANESLMRKGVPPAGNMLHQELAILTGAVELMVVDVQCIFQGLTEVASHFHTKLVSSSPKARIGDSEQIVVDEHHPRDAARAIVRSAVENFANRKDVHIPNVSEPLIAGFSHEYIRYMLGGKMRASLTPLNENIVNGKIRGVAAVVGCSSPRAVQDYAVVNVVRELIANNVLVVVTGCAAITSGKHGLLTPETAEFAGESLHEVCEALGIPPVLHMGSCVDNSRILTVLADVAATGGLGDDIAGLPAVALSPEWFSEKALEIATYAVGSGAHVIFGGVGSPVANSPVVEEYMISGWTERYGGSLRFIQEPHDMVVATLDLIDGARKALKIDVAAERVLFDMDMRRELSV